MKKSDNFDINKWSLMIREELDHSLETLDQSLIGLLPELQSGPAQARLELARRQVKRFKDLMDNLSRLINEREQQYLIAVARGHMHTYLEKLIAPYRNFCKRHHVTLKLEINEGPEGFHAFERLSKIIETLLINALEFCDSTDGRVYIQLTYNEHIKEWSLAVQDNGIGIKKEKLPHIFDPNYAGDDLHLRHFQSVSMGLFLAKTFAKSVGGDLFAKSETLVFSRFEVKWPHAAELVDLAFKNYSLQENYATALKDTTDTIQRSLYGQLRLDNVEESENYLVALCAASYDDVIVELLGGQYSIIFCRDVASALARCLYFGPEAVLLREGTYGDLNARQLARSLRLNESTHALPLIWWGDDSPEEADQHYTASKPLHQNAEALLSFLKRSRLRNAVVHKSNKVKLKSSGDQFLEKIDSIIESNLSDAGFGPAQLASALYIDRSQLHRKLQKLRKLNTSAYIRNYRLKRAHSAIQLGHMNINEVAAWSGFASTSYFSTSFSKFFGKSPTQVSQHN